MSMGASTSQFPILPFCGTHRSAPACPFSVTPVMPWVTDDSSFVVDHQVHQPLIVKLRVCTKISKWLDPHNVKRHPNTHGNRRHLERPVCDHTLWPTPSLQASTLLATAEQSDDLQCLVVRECREVGRPDSLALPCDARHLDTQASCLVQRLDDHTRPAVELRCALQSLQPDPATDGKHILRRLTLTPEQPVPFQLLARVEDQSGSGLLLNACLQFFQIDLATTQSLGELGRRDHPSLVPCIDISFAGCKAAQ
mmetsp:Transcript_56654/g.160716  ORF Transcript_56654/g.160716 Transcript_56654/m.160716 type:complete len:253 (+) Transcript_56654:253-1011(+)